jgi:hypothetical protein
MLLTRIAASFLRCLGRRFMADVCPRCKPHGLANVDILVVVVVVINVVIVIPVVIVICVVAAGFGLVKSIASHG